VAQVLVCLLSKHEALNSNPSTTKKKKKKKPKEKTKPGAMAHASNSSYSGGSQFEAKLGK
jgi:hypothetical protein